MQSRAQHWTCSSQHLLADEAGIEPTTPGLEGRCSIRLSYSPAASIVALKSMVPLCHLCPRDLAEAKIINPGKASLKAQASIG